MALAAQQDDALSEQEAQVANHPVSFVRILVYYLLE
jgi:hypothetical protein